MYIQQLYTNCLAEAAYYIESEGEAAIIDPLRDTQPYLDLAEGRNAKIRYVFETHFHADFVSGHLDIQRKTGAEIVYGPGAKAAYPIYEAQDMEVFQLGAIFIQLLHTPGHTLESCCLLLKDENGKNQAVFTGDTLFAGDVGRPDLAVKSDLGKEDLAGMLYDSIQSKLLVLEDDLIVYPGHGAGSACGKNIGKETQTTIGAQRKTNPTLNCGGKEEFVNLVANGLDEPPKYFFMDAAINKNGYQDINEVLSKNAIALRIDQLLQEQKKGTVVLDTRNPDEFEKGFVPGSINIGLNGQYAVWVGTLIDFGTPLILIADEGKEQEAILRLARVGFERVFGYLDGGFETWLKAGKQVETIASIDAANLNEELGIETSKVIDVRNPSEWNTGIIDGAELLPLSKLESKINNLDPEQTYLIHCAGGYRSMMAASILKKHGFNRIKNIRGGISKIREHGFALVIPQ